MKKLMIILLTLIPFFAFTQRDKIIKIGYIDIQKVLRTYSQGKRVVDYLKNLKNSYETKKISLEKEIKNLENELESKAKNLNEDQVRNYLTKIEAKRKELDIFIKNANQDIDKKEKEMLKPLYQKILKTIREEAPKMRFNFIIDSKYVLVADPELDITNRMIRILERK